MFILFCSQSAFFVIVLITKIEFMSTFSLSKRLSARILAAVLLTFTFTFCSYDDSELRNSMQELQDRITELEKTSGLLQNDINSLKAIFEKLNDAVTVDSAVETEEGWTITFSDGTSVTISVGEAGYTPSIIIVQENGNFYWAYETEDGSIEFLTDGNGEKILAAATAPQVRINPETGNWEISSDGGNTWKDTGVLASGQSGESLVRDIRFEGEMLIIELHDGTVIQLPVTSGLSFAFEEEGPLKIPFGETVSVSYTMTGAVHTSISKPDGWKVRFVENEIEITAPARENTFAETEGTVSVIALNAAGLSAYDELSVSAASTELTGVNLNSDGLYANCYVISSIELTDDGKVVFTTSGTVNGNAVIAVTDGVPVIDPYPRDRGTVLWSWHIWATSEVGDVTCSNNEGKQFTIMDRNLGDWEQPEGSYSTYDGLKYQWGRKDPYVGFNGSGYLLDGAVTFTETDYEPMVGYATSTVSDAATLQEAIQFPEMFFTGTYNNMFDWYGLGAGTDEENLKHRNNYLWGNPDDTAPVKTIYDPCPKGYMVAPAEVFTGFTVDGQNAFSSSSILTEGYFEDGFAFTNASSFFPAAGQLANNSGVLRLVPGPSGREGYYWTSSVGENGGYCSKKCV